MRNDGAGFVFMSGNTILLLKKTKKEIWDIPGGQKDYEENFLDAAKRETKEEIGKLPNYKKFGYFIYENSKNKYKVFFAKIPEPFACKLSDEHDSWGWFHLDNLPHKLHRKVRGAIKFLNKSLKKDPKYGDWFTVF